MPRRIRRYKPFESATKVLMPDITGFSPSYSAAESSGILSYLNSSIDSATSSLTLLALDGPGLINFLEWDNRDTGSGTRAKNPAYSLSIAIDDTQCLSLTFTASTSKTLALIGITGFENTGEEGEQVRFFDPVAFNNRFLLTIKSAAPINSPTRFRAHWRLTQ